MTEADTQLQEIKCVYVELILNQQTKYDVVAGLLQGIMEKDGETYIIICGPEETTAVLNTKFYNIMSIETLEKDCKNMVFLTAEEKDQNIALQLLKELKDILLKKGYGVDGDPEIIDVSKYNDVPDEYKDNSKLNSATPDTSSTVPATTSRTSYPAYTPPAKKEPSPSVLSRTVDKRPSKRALEILREKIEQIKTGKYICTLPETLGKDPDEDDTPDYTHAYSHMYGGFTD